MRQEQLVYHADGLVMRGELFFEQDNDAALRPAVLVFPEGFGLAEPALARARRLAELGYVALACDLHGEGQRVADRERIMSLLAPLREASCARARARPALDALLTRPEIDPKRVAAIGYCMGGLLALELARSGAQIAATVGFHSALATTAPDDASKICGKVLVCLGADDPSIDLSERNAFEAEMRQGGVDWQMNVYGGVVHAFTNVDAAAFGRPDALRYDAQADARSWGAMQELFGEVFTNTGSSRAV